MIRPITWPAPASAAGTTAHIPMPTLKTRRCSSSSTPCSVSQAKTGGRSQESQSSSTLAALRQDAREVAEDAAAGDMCECLDVGTRAQLAHLVDVELVRREQEVGVEVAVAEERPHEREPVRVQAERRQAEDDVAGLDARAVDHLVALDDPDARAREVELLLAVDAGHLRGLAAEERATRGAAGLRGSLDELRDLLERELVPDDVVEEEERLGAGRDHVVHAVRGQVGADRSAAVRPCARARASCPRCPSRPRGTARSSSG